MFTLISILLFQAPTAMANVSVKEAYQAALKRNEDVANQVELVNQAEERYKQAMGAIAPTLNFLGSYTKQDNGSTAAAIYPTDQQTYRINATQPLFRGFREYAALKQQGILSSSAKFNQDQAMIQLYQDVVTSYFNVVSAEQDYQNLLNEIKVNQDRLKDIQEFKRIGRSRDTDVLTIESNIAQLETQVESAKTLIKTTRAIFAFLTDLPNTETLTDTRIKTASVEDMNAFTAKINDRPDVQAATTNVDAADRGVSIARGGHLPSIDLGANYYFDRPGALSNVKWDATLGLTFPIFQGGVIQSGVRVAASQLKQADLGLSKARRLAEEQIETFYENVVGDLRQIQKQKNAVDISQKSYAAEKRDYKLGLVTNLDVLQSLTASQESQRQLDRLLYQYQTDVLKLSSAVIPYGTLLREVSE